MRRERVFGASPGSASIGWISTTDAIFLGLIIALGGIIVLCVKLQDLRKAASDLLNGVEQRQQELGEMLEAEQDATKESRGLPSAAATPAGGRRGWMAVPGRLSQTFVMAAQPTETLVAETKKITADPPPLEQQLTQAKAALETNLSRAAGAIRKLRTEVDALEAEVQSLRTAALDLLKTIEPLQRELDQLLDSERRLSAERRVGTPTAAMFVMLTDDGNTLLDENDLPPGRVAPTRRAAATFVAETRQNAEPGQSLEEQLRQAQVRLEDSLSRAAKRIADLEQELARRIEQDKAIRRELVPLKGPLRRVAILIDTSGSMMSKSGWKDDRDKTNKSRWEEVKSIVATWLEHLQFEECVLITFSKKATAFPADGTLLRVTGTGGEANGALLPKAPRLPAAPRPEDAANNVNKANRQKLKTYLNSVNPGDWTNTLEAMKTAYRYGAVDTIILFTDGAPSSEKSGAFNTAMAEEIYALCRHHQEIPVNCIGLGDYFDKDLSNFMKTIVQITGGTFMGR